MLATASTPARVEPDDDRIESAGGVPQGLGLLGVVVPVVADVLPSSVEDRWDRREGGDAGVGVDLLDDQVAVDRHRQSPADVEVFVLGQVRREAHVRE
jgi:hypothetical protein